MLGVKEKKMAPSAPISGFYQLRDVRQSITNLKLGDFALAASMLNKRKSAQQKSATRTV